MRDLGLEQSGELNVLDYDGQLTSMITFVVRAALPDGRRGRLNAIAVDSDLIFLGRDVLNLLRLLLDGPALRLEILPNTEPTPSS